MEEEDIEEAEGGEEVRGLEAAAGTVILVFATLTVAGYCGFVAATGINRPDGKVPWAFVGHWSVLAAGFVVLGVVFALRGMNIGPESICRKVAKWTAVVMGVDLAVLYLVKSVLLVLQLVVKQ